MSQTRRLGAFTLGEPLRPYIIAEIGVNHGGSMALARQLIEDAAAGGAHAAKFQSYKADKIAIRNSPAYWDTSEEPTATQHALFSKYDAFGPRDFEQLAQHCREVGIEFLSTPFDLEAADFLAPLMPFYKVASADITNIPLIRRCAGHGKPLVISTGASTLAEIGTAVAEAERAGAEYVALLHCVLNYPTPPDHAQIGYIETLRARFPDNPIGYSDHVVPTAGIPALALATLLGSQILEKHFTHDKTLPGNDHYHAMDRDDLQLFCASLDTLRTLYGGHEKDLALESMAITHARRSIVAARAIRAGELLTANNLIAKRPGHGISPAEWDRVVGAAAACDIDEDTPLSWDMVAPTP
jgi:N-acetylneuraminate synthase